MVVKGASRWSLELQVQCGVVGFEAEAPFEQSSSLSVACVGLGL